MSIIRPKPGLTFDDVLLVPRYSAIHPREVSTATRFADLMGAMERDDPHIVVLDASPPARWTTRAAVALQGWRSDVGVLLVTDEPTAGIQQMLPKWGSFDRLTEEIRRTHSRTLSGVLPA